MPTNAGICISGTGAAIVTAEFDDDGSYVVDGIASLPFNLSAVVEEVRALDADEPKGTLFVVDSEGLGNALWQVLGVAPTHEFVLSDAEIAKRARWRLYDKHGFDRQELIDRIAVALQTQRVHFVPDLESMEAMTAALDRYGQRAVGADGQTGSELVTALGLVLLPRPRIGRSWNAAMV